MMDDDLYCVVAVFQHLSHNHQIIACFFCDYLYFCLLNLFSSDDVWCSYCDTIGDAILTCARKPT